MKLPEPFNNLNENVNKIIFQWSFGELNMIEKAEKGGNKAAKFRPVEMT